MKATLISRDSAELEQVADSWTVAHKSGSTASPTKPPSDVENQAPWFAQLQGVFAIS
jgi:hypothetical protein